MDGAKLGLAREDAAREHLANVEFRVGDATALDALAGYDLVYARLLLTHLRDPQAMVERMARARPAGRGPGGPFGVTLHKGWNVKTIAAYLARLEPQLLK